MGSAISTLPTDLRARNGAASPSILFSGLLALALRLPANFLHDDEMLEHERVMRALYGSCRSQQGETHNWTPEART
jgi:hypothetical protein